MFDLVIPLIIGVIAGYLLRNRKHINLNKIVFGTILLLIFSLGFTIGSNNELLNSLPKVGFNALVLCLSAVTFSVLFVKVAKRIAGF
jgi:uncharacterized membrane protein YbjE (DUF340 family)